MSSQELIQAIKNLQSKELQHFLSQILSDKTIMEEIERMGYLKLTEKAFEFWHDPREDRYQDYARTSQKKD